MKCPKCGYNSFEHLASCKKCKADLSETKQRLGISPVTLPAFLAPAMEPSEHPTAPEATEPADDMFSWEITEGNVSGGEPLPFGPMAGDAGLKEEADAGFPAADDGFSFNDAAELPAGQQAVSTARDDMTSFAGMLETIDRELPVPDPLEGFSFDTPEETKKDDIFSEDAERKKPVTDDFDDLFSDDEKTGGGET